MSKPYCCHVGEARHPADWEITDEGEKRPDLGIIHSCHKHLAEMIGSIPPTTPAGPWTVRTLADAGKETT